MKISNCLHHWKHLMWNDSWLIRRVFCLHHSTKLFFFNLNWVIVKGWILQWLIHQMEKSFNSQTHRKLAKEAIITGRRHLGETFRQFPLSLMIQYMLILTFSDLLITAFTSCPLLITLTCSKGSKSHCLPTLIMHLPETNAKRCQSNDMNPSCLIKQEVTIKIWFNPGPEKGYSKS